MTATEASRSFAALLDEAEKGQTIVLTRGGRRIAVIGPASPSNGADLSALLNSDCPTTASPPTSSPLETL